MEEKTPGINPGDSEKSPGTNQKFSASEAMPNTARDRICKNCFMVNPPDSSYCSRCGLKLTEIESSFEKICPGCNAVNDPASQYCYKCGLRLPDEASTEFRYAGFWIRLLAYLIDGFLLNAVNGIIITIIFTIFSKYNSEWEFIINRRYNLLNDSIPGSFWLAYGIIFFIVYAIEIAYFTISIGKWGKTLGKAAIGAKVIRTDGSRVGYWRAFSRFWAYVLNGLTLNIGFLIIVWTSKKQGLHDMICDTIVVKTK